MSRFSSRPASRPSAFRLSLVLLGLASGCATTAQTSGPQTHVKPEALTGSWTSAVCESMSNADGSTTYFKRHFTMTPGEWSLKFQAFGDPGCTVGLFTARVEGPYTLGQDSAKVDGATEANFGFRRHFMTAHVQQVADWFQGAHCGTEPWKVGQEQETTATGCVFLRPVASCGADHDVVKVTGRELFFGQRPADNDMCAPSKRPTALTRVAVVRD